jgi:hypothetical protein
MTFPGQVDTSDWRTTWRQTRVGYVLEVGLPDYVGPRMAGIAEAVVLPSNDSGRCWTIYVGPAILDFKGSLADARRAARRFLYECLTAAANLVFAFDPSEPAEPEEPEEPQLDRWRKAMGAGTADREETWRDRPGLL